MWFTLPTDAGTIRVGLDQIALVEEVPGGYLVTLALPARRVAGRRSAKGRLRVLELTAEQGRPLVEYLDSIARHLTPRPPGEIP